MDGVEISEVNQHPLPHLVSQQNFIWTKPCGLLSAVVLGLVNISGYYLYMKT